jgi:predicted transcriptional regulator
VVHHALSNDTYRLDLAGGLVLEALLVSRQPLPVEALADSGLDATTVADALTVLHDLGFVAPC